MCINSMEAFKKIDLEGKVLAAVSDLPEAVQTRSDFLGSKVVNILIRVFCGLILKNGKKIP